MKKTPLHHWHLQQGANMAPFGEYEMPLWYPSGAKAEHLSVINGAGLFDTSHMAGLVVSGGGARTLLQHCFSKDLEQCIGAKKLPLSPGRAGYGLFLRDNGFVIDDGLVYQVAENLYFVVVNSGMGGIIAEHLSDHRKEGEVKIEDLTDRLGKIDIQGKESARIMAALLENPEEVLSAMPYFSFKGWFRDSDDATPVRLKDGTPIILSRTGYTGEFGFELFLPADKTEQVWNALLEVGASKGLIACGLAARDSLRAGAVLPLSHQDIGDWPFAGNPWPFALADRAESGKFTAPFIGSEALEALEPAEFTLAYAGYDLRKMTGENACVTDGNGNRIGTILTCATDMAIGRTKDGIIVSIATPEENGRPADFKAKGLCCGFVKVNKKFAPGEQLLLTDGKRNLKVEVRTDIRPDRTARKALKNML